MNEQTKALLRKLGVKQQTIDDLIDEAKAKEVKVDDVYTETMDVLKNSLRNDEAFVSDLEKKHRAAVLSSKEKKFMKAFEYLGLTDDDLSELPESRKFDAMIELVATKAKDAKLSGDSKEEVAKLNKLVADLKDEKRKLVEEEIPSIRSQVQKDREAIQIENQLRKSLGSHKLVIEADDAMAIVGSKINAKYDIKLVDGKPKVFQKGKDLEAVDDNHRPIAVDALVEQTVTESKLKIQSNGGNQKTERTGGEDPPKYQPKGLSKAQEHLDSLRKKD